MIIKSTRKSNKNPITNKEANKIIVKLIGNNKINLENYVSHTVLSRISKKSTLTPIEIDILVQKIIEFYNKPIKSKQTEKDWKYWIKYMNIFAIIYEMPYKKIYMDSDERHKLLEPIINNEFRGSLSRDFLLTLPWGERENRFDSNYHRADTKKEKNDAEIRQQNWNLIYNNWQKKCGAVCKYWWYVGGNGEEDQWSGPPGTGEKVLNALSDALSECGKNNWPMWLSPSPDDGHIPAYNNEKANKIIVKLIGNNKIKLTGHVPYTVLLEIAKKSTLVPTEIDILVQKIIVIHKKQIKSKQTQKDWKYWRKYTNILTIIYKSLLLKSVSYKKMGMDVDKQKKLLDPIQDNTVIGSLSYDSLSHEKVYYIIQENWDIIYNNWYKKCGTVCNYWQQIDSGDDDNKWHGPPGTGKKIINKWYGPPGTGKKVINNLRDILYEYGAMLWIKSDYYEIIGGGRMTIGIVNFILRI